MIELATAGQFVLIICTFVLVIMVGVLLYVFSNIRHDLRAQSKETQKIVVTTMSSLSAEIDSLKIRVLALEAFINKAVIRDVQFGEDDLADFQKEFTSSSKEQ